MLRSMALTKSLFDLIATPNGSIAKEFLSHTAHSWAKEHMTRRYGHAVPQENDGPNHPSRICFNRLLAEHGMLMGWFPNGMLSQLLMGRYMASLKKGPLEAGYGWDFKDNGDVDPGMIQFKASLISATRTMESLQPKQRIPENLSVTSVANLVRDAYRIRASSHAWRAVEKVDRVSDTEAETRTVLTGAELCNRWVSFQTFNFLVDWVPDRGWCWIASKSAAAFGPADDYPAKNDR